MKVQACPFCNRSLFNRLIDKCGYCGKDLPEEYCLSVEEKEKLTHERNQQYNQRKKAYNFHNKLHIRTINANLSGENMRLVQTPESNDE